MTQVAFVVLSLAFSVVVMVVVTAVVSSRVRRAPATSTWKATREGVLFVVCLRRGQRVVIRTFAIVVIVIGCVLFAAAVTGAGSTLGMGIAGVVMVVVGVALLWLVHGMARLRLEVAPDTVWAFPLAGAPRQIALGEIVQLAPLRSNNYGGIVARSAAESLFSATRIMLGYPQLIDHLQARRPDLVIPEASRPLQSSGAGRPEPG